MPDPPGIWYDGPIDPCVSVNREPVTKSCESKVQTIPPHSNNNRTIQYSNWESCRESWFSSGSSELRPSSGSDCPQNIANNCSKTAPAHVLDNNVKNSAPTTPHLKRTRDAGTSTPSGGAGSPSAATLPRSAVGCGLRQSSRDSGSSSSRPNSRPGTRPNTR